MSTSRPLAPADAGGRQRHVSSSSLLETLWARVPGPRALALLLTLALVILHAATAEPRGVALAMIGVALVTACSRRAREHPLPWFALTALVGASVAYTWYWADNHKFLLVYWCLAIACALTSRDERALARSARLLVGLCFAFACVWKLLSPDYLDGRVFHYLLLGDPRFAPLGEWLGGATSPASIPSLLPSRTPVSGPMPTLSLLGAPWVRPVARALAWWTLAIELTVALAFLTRAGGRPDPLWRLARRRDAVLLLFIVTTYTLAPVPGFAWLLIAMGLSQVPAGRRNTKFAYVCALLLTQLYFVVYGLNTAT